MQINGLCYTSTFFNLCPFWESDESYNLRKGASGGAPLETTAVVPMTRHLEI